MAGCAPRSQLYPSRQAQDMGAMLGASTFNVELKATGMPK
jgi:hypothetical protein